MVVVSGDRYVVRDAQAELAGGRVDPVGDGVGEAEQRGRPFPPREYVTRHLGCRRESHRRADDGDVETEPLGFGGDVQISGAIWRAWLGRSQHAYSPVPEVVQVLHGQSDPGAV